MSRQMHTRWSSSTGFGLAALGAAVGLGTIWRFPYVMGEYGGGAFLLAYVLAVLVLGWPLMMAETAIGRHMHADGIAAYQHINAKRPWRWVGWLGVAACLLILSYYPVITGWVGRYLWLALHGDLGVLATDTQAERFARITQDGGITATASLLATAAATAIVAAGVSAGIERYNRVLMPLFFFLLLALAVYGMGLPGRTQAMNFMFRPEWSALRHPHTWLAAFGQALFSLSLAMGTLVIYGSYLDNDAALPRISFIVIAGTSPMENTAGKIARLASRDAMLVPAQGPGLVFVVLPEVFANMADGAQAGVVFFLLLLTVALTSLVSLLELPASLLISRLGMKRLPAALLSGAGTFVLTLPAALGAGHFAGGRTLLDKADQLSSQLLLPASALAIALLAGWKWNATAACDAVGLQSSLARRSWWLCLRHLVPVFLAIVLITGLIDVWR